MSQKPSQVIAFGKHKQQPQDAGSRAGQDHSGAHVPARRIVARYPIATVGSRTRRGGRVIDAHGHDDEFRVACVGDRVRYPDGSESVIISGAGHASTFADRPIALVGSHIANGDRIVAPAQSMGEIFVVEGEQSAVCWNPATCRRACPCRTDPAN